MHPPCLFYGTRLVFLGGGRMEGVKFLILSIISLNVETLFMKKFFFFPIP